MSIRETWGYENLAAMDLVWIKTSQDAAADSYTFVSDGVVVNGPTGGTDGYFGTGVTFGGGLGGGGGFAKHTRTFTGFTPNTTVTVTCERMRVSTVSFQNAGLSLNGEDGHVPTTTVDGVLDGPVTVVDTADANGEFTVTIGHFDLEFGMDTVGLTFGAITVDGAREDDFTHYLFDGRIYSDDIVAISQTRHGLSFAPQRVIEQEDYDGKAAPQAGLDFIVSERPVIRGKVIQFGPPQMRVIDPGSTTTQYGALVTRQIPKHAGQTISRGTLLRDFICEWDRSDGGLYRVRFPLALCTKYEHQGTDRGEVICAVEFEARSEGEDEDLYYIDWLEDES